MVNSYDDAKKDNGFNDDQYIVRESADGYDPTVKTSDPEPWPTGIKSEDSGNGNLTRNNPAWPNTKAGN